MLDARAWFLSQKPRALHATALPVRRPLAFKCAFSAPASLPVLFRSRKSRWRSGARNSPEDRTRTKLGRRRESADSFTSLYPDPPLRSRPACARAARSARPGSRVTQLGLRVSPNFAVVRTRSRFSLCAWLCASVCPPQFAVRLVLARRGRAPRQGPRAAARRPVVPVASSRAACLQRPSAGRPQNDPRIS